MATAEELKTLRTQLAQLRGQNEALHTSMETIQQKQQEGKDESHHGEMDDPVPQPLSAKIWGAPVLENFKAPIFHPSKVKAIQWSMSQHSTLAWPSSEPLTLSNANCWRELSLMSLYVGT
jgi:hypothetical protein